jgi:hypothetical protein
MAEHALKTWPGAWMAVDSGRKTFEVRRNDRSFAEGDELVLREYDTLKGHTGRECRRRVTYVHDLGPYGFSGHVGMSIAASSEERQT